MDHNIQSDRYHSLQAELDGDNGMSSWRYTVIPKLNVRYQAFASAVFDLTVFKHTYIYPVDDPFFIVHITSHFFPHISLSIEASESFHCDNHEQKSTHFHDRSHWLHRICYN